MKNNIKADIADIFSSIQGEGVFLGARQIFVRFRDCNLNCIYCDEPRNVKSRQFTVQGLTNEVLKLEKSHGPHHSVSLTGGEPLLYTEFLEHFLKKLTQHNFKIYLETNGVLFEELARVIDMVDIIAMDFKLPSSTGEMAHWDEHMKFLRLASVKKVFVKAVVTDKTSDEDINKLVALLKGVNDRIPLILQPVTPLKRSEKVVDSKRLLNFLDIASKKHLDNIRIIPQIHKTLGVK